MPIEDTSNIATMPKPSTSPSLRAINPLEEAQLQLAIAAPAAEAAGSRLTQATIDDDDVEITSEACMCEDCQRRMGPTVVGDESDEEPRDGATIVRRRVTACDETTTLLGPRIPHRASLPLLHPSQMHREADRKGLRSP